MYHNMNGALPSAAAPSCTPHGVTLDQPMYVTQWMFAKVFKSHLIPSTSEGTMRYYDSLAEGYELLYGDEQRRKYRIIANRFGIGTDDAVLDVGCGSGIGSVMGCTIVGIDPSEEMIRRAPFPAQVGAAEDLPFPNGSFDYVVSVTAIHHVSNIARALLEIRRVGRKGYAISFLKGSPKAAMIDRLIHTHFDVERIVDDVKDRIYILRYPR